MDNMAAHQYQNSPNFNGSNLIVSKTKYDTPLKNKFDETAQKTLMKNVMERISSAKQNATNKYSQFAKKLNDKQSSQSNKNNEQNDSMNQDKQLVLRNQSPNNPGFYEYVHWLKLHVESFSYVDKKYVQQFWKILRLVNYGEVLIPTGLVYEIIMEVKSNTTTGGFQRIINKFLSQNQTTDRINSFKEIKNYISLLQLQKQYKSIKEIQPLKNKKRQFNSLNKQPSRCNSAKNVFERNFNEAKSREVKKITQICDGIVQQSKKCYQKPKISVYKSESFQSLIKPARICQNAEQHKWRNQQEKFLEDSNNIINNLFRAKQFDKSLFQGNIEQIPGVVSHLSRNHYSQAERLRLKRQAQKPQYSKKRVF